MANRKIILIGCGAQAKYCREIFTLTGREIVRVLDPMGGKVGQDFYGLTIEAFQAELVSEALSQHKDAGAVVCLSDNARKKEIFEDISKYCPMVSAIHPHSTIASSASVGSGVIVNARAVIQPNAQVGDGCMIHAGVIVEHDNRIGNFVNLGPGVILAGGVRVEQGATLLTGAMAAPNVKIGAWTTVGAGSLVLGDLPPKVLAYGNPAKIIKQL